MNQEKIGRFIAKCRKENGYTQAIVFVIIFFFALFAWFAGRNIGEDLGEFIYNISH